MFTAVLVQQREAVDGHKNRKKFGLIVDCVPRFTADAYSRPLGFAAFGRFSHAASGHVVNSGAETARRIRVSAGCSVRGPEKRVKSSSHHINV